MTDTPVSPFQTNPEVSIADIKAYWDRRPCNIRHSNAALGTKAYFDEVEARRYLVEPHIPRFAQFDRWKGKLVLEIGCGIGTDAVNFARAGASYSGVDLSPVSLDLAKKRFEVFGLQGDFIVGNVEQLSQLVPQNAFDLVYAFGVVHHTPNQRAAVEEVRKIIKSDGEFRCMLYAENSWKGIMIEAGFDQPEAQAGCPVATLYSPQMIHELFRGLFELESVQQTHIFPYVIEKYIKYQYEVQPWFREMPPKMFAALEKNLGWHYLLTARPARCTSKQSTNASLL